MHLLAALFLFYEAQLGVQHACRFFWEDWGSDCRLSGWRTTTLPPQPQPPLTLHITLVAKGSLHSCLKLELTWQQSAYQFHMTGFPHWDMQQMLHVPVFDCMRDPMSSTSAGSVGRPWPQRWGHIEYGVWSICYLVLNYCRLNLI